MRQLPLDKARYAPIVRLSSLITGIYYMPNSTAHRSRLALLVYSRVCCQLMSCMSAEYGGTAPTKKTSTTLHTDNLYFHDIKEVTLHGHEFLSELGISLSQTLEEAAEHGFDEEHAANAATRSESSLLPVLKFLNRKEQRAEILPARSSSSHHKQLISQGPVIKDLIVCVCVSKSVLIWNKAEKSHVDDDDETFSVANLRRLNYT